MTGGPAPGGFAATLRSSPYLALSLAMIASNLAIIGYFSGELDRLSRFYDGPLYMYVAKTLYWIPADHPFGESLPASYFASHLPLYPLLIRLGAFFTGGNYPWAMLAATLMTSIAAVCLFYKFLDVWAVVPDPLWTALVFIVLPSRWLIYHTVGATEPLFISSIFAALIFYKQERPALLILSVGLACLTRTTGILLVPVFGLLFVLRGEWRRAAAMPLAYAGMLALFAFFQLRFGDVFVHFTWNVDGERMLGSLPFSALSETPNMHVVESFLALYFIYGIGTLSLREHRPLFVLSATFYLFTILVVHMDISRFFFTLAPFSLLIGFNPIIESRPFKWFFPVMVCLGYVYALEYIPTNLLGEDTYAKLLEALTS